jgi:hypothetical protein
MIGAVLVLVSISISIGIICAGCASKTSQSVALEKGFANPPEAAKPRTWWHWVAGNASKEGITADLEAMKRIGVGGAQMFTVDQAPKELDGPILYMSPEWRELVKHAVAEAHRLGLELTIHDCEGWSESGGPWITPELSMQKVVWSEAHVRGPTSFEEQLDTPETVRGYYQDIAVFAFPSLPGEQAKLADMHPKISASTTQPINGEKLTDGFAKSSVEVDRGEDGTAWIQIELPQPVRVGSFTVSPIQPRTTGEIQVSDDGKNFRKLASFTTNNKPRTQQTFIFDEVNARFFRIFAAKTPKAPPLTIGEIDMAATRVPDYRAKTGLMQTVQPDHPPAVDVARDVIIRPENVVDLTTHMDAHGNLSWQVPDGDWTILRIGHTSTGKTNHPAMKATEGLECDKMSRQAVEANFNGMLAKVTADSRSNIGKGLNMVLMDSWEAGCQNWTPKFREEFINRNGYDPLPWMVAMSGRYVESPEKTERFLWDYRRLIADLIAENHYGLMQELCHKHGLKLTAEAPGIGMPTIADELQCKSFTDVPMGEFWVNRHDDNSDTREAASAAHIYAKTIAAAESFTATPENANWMNDPWSLKAQGDEQFCAGINRYVFHRYAHQPWLDRKPGMTMGPWGINFERTNTWWEPGKAWISYISRCQFMLQRGLFVGDLVYYYGEGAPRNLQPAKLNPKPPEGFNYDGCNTDVLLNRTTVKSGRIFLPDGMSYRVLVLPDTDVMTPQVLAKVKKLVAAGATVVGRKPVASPSLVDYPQCDRGVRAMADDLWANCDGVHKIERKYGKGRICWNKPIEEVLNVSKDFRSSQEGLRWIHRRDRDTDIYFVANPQQNFVAADCTFRISGAKPQIWHPDTGEIEKDVAYNDNHGVMTVPIRFEPLGSVFVVFKKSRGGADSIVAINRGQTDVLRQAVATTQKLAEVKITKATYGVPNGTSEQQMDVTDRVARELKEGRLSVHATNDFAGKDPAQNIPKSLTVKYTLDGKPATASVRESEILEIPGSSILSGHPAAQLNSSRSLEVWEAGDYTLKHASGKAQSARVASLPAPIEIEGEWTLAFPPKLGAPDSPVKLDKLIAWNEHSEEGVKHFSGTATYTKQIYIPADMIGEGKHVYLELGAVKNLAEVIVNGKSLGILWKPPFRVDITGAAKSGANEIEIKVTNLWPNRMIGDQALPKDKRITWAAHEPFKKDTPLLTSGLLGPVRLVPTVIAPIK